MAQVERDGISFLQGLDRLLGEQAARRRDRGIVSRDTSVVVRDLLAYVPGTTPASGKAQLAKYAILCEFAQSTADMLEYLVDVLVPRDFDRMAADGFREIITLLRPRP